jgi:hypothetical protein
MIQPILSYHGLSAYVKSDGIYFPEPLREDAQSALLSVLEHFNHGDV